MNKTYLKWFVLILGFTMVTDAYGKELVDKIVAVVNKDVITQSELNSAVAAIKQKAENKEELRKQTLQDLIDDRLFSQALKEEKIEVTEDDLARAINNVLAQNRIPLDTLIAGLRSQGVSYEQYKKQMEREIRRLKFINQVIGPQVKLSEQDLRDYYQKHLDQFQTSKETPSDHFEKVRDKVYGAAYDERVQEALNGYLLKQRRKAFVDIR
ncbi:MAG: SurA N-terminal domain-containing protein [Deltaproteobacteria bacterium]|nr:SurA N-terminal domain-containing protein [Deltaproteobacteria bacterium]